MNSDTLQIVILVATIGTVVSAARLVGAYIRRMSPGNTPVSRDVPTRAEADQLRDQVERLAGDVAELQERVDFTERLLARQRDAERLKG